MRTKVGDEAEVNGSDSFESGLKALWAASTHRTTREALMFEEQHLRFIVQNSPVREKLNSWDASMIRANETRLENISKFIALLDNLAQESRVSPFEADELIFLFHRTLTAAFEIGSVCYPSRSAAGKIRDLQSTAARRTKAANKDVRYEVAKPLIREAQRGDGSILNWEKLRSKVNERLEAIKKKDGTAESVSVATLRRYQKRMLRDPD